ncbi:phosphoribosylglycinamide formyltransferase [Blastopirellula marina]|uniref:Phosphoribosylglycinamide formyltransferase n=1 Tax=Blastopirellula marina TaxID=124 RepID=A0A2S8GCI9_9BACT|nr:phosphoribosylglycinamide formyltransferase [Blastopirellula marina]PQO42182.1 phosphoribosylglycinamide formyltransferase [Blastopirellula marina]
MTDSAPTTSKHTSANPLKIAVLISGGGTTLRNLLERIDQDHLPLEIVLVISSSRTAKGMVFAENANIPCKIITTQDHPQIADFSADIFHACRKAGVELVVMGGFLKRIAVPADFENRVVNIHPSLIPSFCGEGFYGGRVHAAVLEYGAKLSGCTVHFVDDHYDHGPIIAQQAVEVLPGDTPATLAERVFEAECQLYPATISAIAEGRVSAAGRQITVQPG